MAWSGTTITLTAFPSRMRSSAKAFTPKRETIAATITATRLLIAFLHFKRELSDYSEYRADLLRKR